MDLVAADMGVEAEILGMVNKGVVEGLPEELLREQVEVYLVDLNFEDPGRNFGKWQEEWRSLLPCLCFMRLI
jgi:hypothetical protein